MDGRPWYALLVSHAFQRGCQAPPGIPNIIAAELRVQLHQVGIGGQWRGTEEGRQLTAPQSRGVECGREAMNQASNMGNIVHFSNKHDEFMVFFEGCKWVRICCDSYK